MIGAGLGATITPSMAVAYQHIANQAVPQATSAINVIQRVAGSLGTTLLAVVLQAAINSRLPRLDGGIGQAAALAARQGAPVTAALADAFATTFWVALALTAAALLPALLLPDGPSNRDHTAAGHTPAQPNSRSDGSRSRSPLRLGQKEPS